MATSDNTVSAEALIRWLRAIVSAMPHGGKKRAAEILGVTPSGISKLLNEPDRGFDEKTLRAVAWLLQSKSENYDSKKYPVIRTTIVDGLILETRKFSGGELVTWTPVPETKK